MTSNKKIYIGCSLTHSTAEFKDGIERLKKILRAEGYEILDFLGVSTGEHADVFNWDIRGCVKNCDAFIAICDEPAIGLGYEIAEAVNLKKPVLALAHKDARVSRLVQGAAEVLPDFEFERYQDLDKDIIELVNKWLRLEGVATKTAAQDL